MRVDTAAVHHRPGRPHPLVLGVALLAIIGLPIGVYEWAIHTSIGPVLLMFSWSPGEGVHAGDLAVLLLVLPAWLAAVGRLAGVVRRGRPHA